MTIFGQMIIGILVAVLAIGAAIHNWWLLVVIFGGISIGFITNSIKLIKSLDRGDT